MNKLAAQSPTVPVRWDNWVSMWYLFHVWAMIIQPRSFLMDLKKYHVNCDFVQVIPELIANTAIIFIDELGEKNVGLLAR